MGSRNREWCKRRSESVKRRIVVRACPSREVSSQGAPAFPDSRHLSVHPNLVARERTPSSSRPEHGFHGAARSERRQQGGKVCGVAGHRADAGVGRARRLSAVSRRRGRGLLEDLDPPRLRESWTGSDREPGCSDPEGAHPLPASGRRSSLTHRLQAISPPGAASCRGWFAALRPVGIDPPSLRFRYVLSPIS